MRSIFALTMFFVGMSVTSAQKADTTFYSVVTNGFITGEQKSWRVNNNEYHYLYYYNDRGRGENYYQTIRTDDEGQIISANTSGVDYYKNSYSFKYYIQNDSAVWITNNDRNSVKYNNQLYSLTAAPGVFELKLKWLLKQPYLTAQNLFGNTTFLKNGPVAKTISFNGKTVSLKLFELYFNRDPESLQIWLTEDMHFFSGGGVILKGYESWMDTLTVIQELVGADYFLKQSREYSMPLTKHQLIIHANLFKSSNASVEQDMSVEVLNGKIISIFSSGEKRKTRADTIIDAKGKFLMPGLWDMHCHYNKSAGLWYLAGGVTHVRDMGNSLLVQLWQKQIRKNELLGPDISYLSGFIDKEDSLQGPVGKIVRSLAQALETVDYYHQKRYNQIKLYSSIKPEWVKPIADHAHALGMRVAGHVPAYMTATQAIDAGYNEITHNNMIFLNFMGADTLATNGILRMRLPAALSGTIDLESKEAKTFFQLMKKNSVSHDPTLGVQEGFYDEFKGDTSNRLKRILDWMPEKSKNNITKTSSVGSEEQKPSYKASFLNSKKLVKLLFDNGILLVAGTDGGNAIALHRELEIYNEAGIPANEVLKIATYNAAKNCGLENVYGQIKVGVEADFILIDGNPSKNISDIRRVEWVIKNGRMYSPEKLYASQDWKYYY
jgi:imidazolonepropionase-like amidohydrolase